MAKRKQEELKEDVALDIDAGRMEISDDLAEQPVEEAPSVKVPEAEFIFDEEVITGWLSDAWRRLFEQFIRVRVDGPGYREDQVLVVMRFVWNSLQVGGVAFLKPDLAQFVPENSEKVGEVGEYFAFLKRK